MLSQRQMCSRSCSSSSEGMGRGRHRLPTKEKLKDECEQRIASKEVGDHRVFILSSTLKLFFSNQIISLFREQEGGNRFLQTENLNCIALCEGKTGLQSPKDGSTSPPRQIKNSWFLILAWEFLSKAGWMCPQWSPQWNWERPARFGCVPTLTTCALVSSLCE